MKEFTVIAEIWFKGKLSYLTTVMTGEYIPTQDDMEARDNIVQALDEQYKQYEILDLVGVVYKGDELWQDI